MPAGGSRSAEGRSEHRRGSQGSEYTRCRLEIAPGSGGFKSLLTVVRGCVVAGSQVAVLIWCVPRGSVPPAVVRWFCVVGSSWCGERRRLSDSHSRRRTERSQIRGSGLDSTRPPVRARFHLARAETQETVAASCLLSSVSSRRMFPPRRISAGQAPPAAASPAQLHQPRTDATQEQQALWTLEEVIQQRRRSTPSSPHPASSVHRMPAVAAVAPVLAQPTAIDELLHEAMEPADRTHYPHQQQMTSALPRHLTHWPPQAPFLLPVATAPLVQSLTPVLSRQAHWQRQWKEIAVQHIPKSGHKQTTHARALLGTCLTACSSPSSALARDFLVFEISTFPNVVASIRFSLAGITRTTPSAPNCSTPTCVLSVPRCPGSTFVPSSGSTVALVTPRVGRGGSSEMSRHSGGGPSGRASTRGRGSRGRRSIGGGRRWSRRSRIDRRRSWNSC